MACAVLHNFNVFRILLTEGTYFKETRSCAECFDANFKQNHTCAECFAQALWKTTFQSFRQVFDLKSRFKQNYRFLTVFHNLQLKRLDFFCQFYVFRLLLTKEAHFKRNQSCAQCFDANFKQNHSYAECFPQLLSKTDNRSSLDIIDHTHQFR